MTCYKVEFTSGNHTYAYSINAESGEVLEAVTGTRTPPRPRTALRRIPLHPARPPLRRRLPPTSTPLPARWTRPRRRRSLWHTPGSRRRTPPSPSPSWTMTMAVRCTKLNGTRTARSTTMRSTPPPASCQLRLRRRELHPSQSTNTNANVKISEATAKADRPVQRPRRDGCEYLQVQAGL